MMLGVGFLDPVTDIVRMFNVLSLQVYFPADNSLRNEFGLVGACEYRDKDARGVSIYIEKSILERILC